MLLDETVKRIRVGRVTASWALKEVVAGFIRRFEALDDLFTLQVNFCGSEFEHSDGRADYAKRILQNRM